MDLNNYIDDNIHNIELKTFIKNLIISPILKENQLGMYILIESKFNLLQLKHFEDILIEIKANGLGINFDTFITHRPNVLENECLTKKHTYSRIVSKVTFDNYIGDFLFDTPYIDHSKININGWSTRNGIVWITPKNELDDLISSVLDTNEITNSICDYLGLPRQYDDEEYFRVNYSEDFSECVYQPNSSNILWIYDFILFVPFKKIDYFGRTYNENGINFGREQIHKKSYYIDDKFNVQKIGKIKKKIPINDNILIEAKTRLLS